MKTIASIVVMLIAYLAQQAGIELDLTDQEHIIDSLNSIFVIGGGLSAIFFRYKATRDLKGGKLDVSRTPM